MADTSSDGKTYLDTSTYYKFLFCSAIIFFTRFIRRLSCLFASDNRGIFPSHRETDARTQTSRPSPHLPGRRNAGERNGRKEREREGTSCLCRSERYRLVFLLSFHRHCEKDIRERDSLTVEDEKKVYTHTHVYIYRIYTYIYPIDSFLRGAHARKDAYAGRRRERSCCRCCWRSRYEVATKEDGLGIERARDSRGGVGGWSKVKRRACA